MELLTIQETAQVLKVSPVTIRRYIADGRLPAVRVGKGIRVHKEAVERLAEPVSPRAPRRQTRVPRGKPTSFDDPLWNIVGIGASAEAERADATEDIHELIARAYESHSG